ncbi:MAG: hypothetical protein IJ528_04355 [Bacteroidaceae bacterium]|nr:hypothetical protein [Bacteroidaceae bacterium]
MKRYYFISHIILRYIMAVVCGFASIHTFGSSVSHVIPLYVYPSNSPVSVTKIDYEDKATTVYFKTHKNTGATFRFGHGIYIVGDDGERRHTIAVSGIKLDSLYVLCSGQHMTFSISFQPVGQGNTCLDICSPSQFALYGLHDKNVTVNIPQAEVADINPEDIADNYKDGFAEIEGVLHVGNPSGQIVYADYTPYRSAGYDFSPQYAQCDADGCFKMKFELNSPRLIQFLSRRSGELICGSVMVRPGDKLNVHLYRQEDGVALAYTNQSGRDEYIRLCNAPRTIYSSLPFRNNIKSHFTEMTYPQHMQCLMDEYHRMMEFSNYVCWHYRLSPAESLYYIQHVRNMLLWTFLTSDQALQTQMREAQDIGERNKYKAWFNSRTFDYLRLISPDNTSFLIMPLSDEPEVMVGLKPLSDVFDSVSLETPNRWLEIIEAQQNLLHDITGWPKESFIMERIIVSGVTGYWQSNGYKLDSEQITRVREMIHHPYNRKCFDTVCGEYTNKSVSR